MSSVALFIGEVTTIDSELTAEARNSTKTTVNNNTFIDSQFGTRFSSDSIIANSTVNSTIAGQSQLAVVSNNDTVIFALGKCFAIQVKNNLFAFGDYNNIVNCNISSYLISTAICKSSSKRSYVANLAVVVCICIILIVKTVGFNSILSCENGQVEVDFAPLILVTSSFIHMDRKRKVVSFANTKRYRLGNRLCANNDVITVAGPIGNGVILRIRSNGVLHYLVKIFADILNIKTNGILESKTTIVLNCQISNLSFSGFPKGLGIVVLCDRAFTKDWIGVITNVFITVASIHQKLNIERTGHDLVT